MAHLSTKNMEQYPKAQNEPFSGVLFVPPGAGDLLVSAPPPGCMKIKNIYVNAAGKTIVEYDDAPV